MRLRSLLFMLLVAAAALAAHRARGATAEAVAANTRAPAAATRGTSAAGPASVARRAAERETPRAVSIAPVSNGAARVRNAFGSAGSRVVGPTVVGMTTKTENQLIALGPAVQRAPPMRRQKAERAAKQIRELDTAALQHVADGRPLAAMRSAMRARELLDIVRAQLIEEAIR